MSLDWVQKKSLDLGADEDGKVQIMQPEHEIHIALGASYTLLHSRNVLHSQESASQVLLPNCGDPACLKVQSRGLICFSQARSQPLGLQ